MSSNTIQAVTSFIYTVLIDGAKNDERFAANNLSDVEGKILKEWNGELHSMTFVEIRFQKTNEVICTMTRGNIQSTAIAYYEDGARAWITSESGMFVEI